MKTEHGKSQLISKDMCQKIKRKIVRAEDYAGQSYVGR